MHIRLRIAAAVLPAIFVVVGPTVVFPRAADRPTVAGPNGAVSAGHPLTTAAAFEVLLKGGNAFDAGVAAMLVGGVVEQDLYSLGGEGLVLVYPQRDGKVTSIVGQGWAPKGATIDWYTRAGQEPGRHRSRSGGRARRAACGAHGARTLGHDELRAGLGCARSSTPSAAFRCGRGRRRRSTSNLQVHRGLAGQQARLAEARRLGLQGRRHHQAAGPGAHADAMVEAERKAAREAAARPASSRRATGSTRATSRARWSRS